MARFERNLCVFDLNMYLTLLYFLIVCEIHVSSSNHVPLTHFEESSADYIAAFATTEDTQRCDEVAKENSGRPRALTEEPSFIGNDI